MEEDDGDDSLPPLKKESELPFVPNYLANPAFPFLYTPAAAEDAAQLQNGGPSTPPASPPAESTPPLLPAGEPPLVGAFPRDHASLALVQNRDVSAPSAILRTPESTKPGPVCQPPVSQSRSLFSSVPSKPPVSLEPQNGTYAGPAPAFQPFFFTGAFPFNMQGNPPQGTASAGWGGEGAQRSSVSLPSFFLGGGLGGWDLCLYLFMCLGPNCKLVEVLQEHYKELPLARLIYYLRFALSPAVVKCVFPKSKESLLHNHSPVTTFRKCNLAIIPFSKPPVFSNSGHVSVLVPSAALCAPSTPVLCPGSPVAFGYHTVPFSFHLEASSALLYHFGPQYFLKSPGQVLCRI